MKILQSAIWHAAALGVNPQQAYVKHPAFSCRSVLAFLALSLSAVSCALYFIRLANTFIEYTYTIYALSSMIVTNAILLIVSFKMREFFDILHQLEDTINERKQILLANSYDERYKLFISGLQYPESQKIYEKINPKVEEWCKLIYFLNMKVFFPTVMSMKFVFSFVQYFMTNLGNDAFEVPLPFW